MNTIVTDGELGRLAIKQHELFTRVKKGVLPLEGVLAALQSVIEGKDPVVPALNPQVSYRVWKTIKIGGVKADELFSRIDKKKEMGVWGRNIMKQKEFTTLDAEEETDLIDLTPKDFGFTEPPRTNVFLDPKRLAEWSSENLDGYVLELCPAEVGPHLREQYEDQPNGEILFIAMERISDSVGDPGVLSVGRHDDGGRWLNARYARLDRTWSLDFRFLFRLRKVTQS